jgi:hypothetical protein
VALTPGDDKFLEVLSRRSFAYFWEHGETPTGQARARARNGWTNPDVIGIDVGITLSAESLRTGRV